VSTTKPALSIADPGFSAWLRGLGADWERATAELDTLSRATHAERRECRSRISPIADAIEAGFVAALEEIKEQIKSEFAKVEAELTDLLRPHCHGDEAMIGKVVELISSGSPRRDWQRVAWFFGKINGQLLTLRIERLLHLIDGFRAGRSCVQCTHFVEQETAASPTA